jgi:hypothetical protein
MAVTVDDRAAIRVQATQALVASRRGLYAMPMHNRYHTAGKRKPVFLWKSLQYAPVRDGPPRRDVIVPAYRNHPATSWQHALQHLRLADVPGVDGIVTIRNDVADAVIKMPVCIGNDGDRDVHRSLLQLGDTPRQDSVPFGAWVNPANPD